MTRIKKVVITAAGTGTRLLPFTKETPKEMLPILTRSINGEFVLKPILQVIYESIFDFGIRNFCFVIGKGKRSIEDHFLISNHNNSFENNIELQKFFDRIKKSNLSFVQQPYPQGFGDAVYQARHFVGKDSFLLHAGDDVILSSNNNHLKNLENAFSQDNVDMAFLVSRMKDPRKYGVIESKEIRKGIFKVTNLEEKPVNPKSNLAVIAIYMFRPSIFEAIKKTKADKKNEVQLASAVQKIIKKGNSIAVELGKNEKRLDVGTPEGFVKCINDSFQSIGGKT